MGVACSARALGLAAALALTAPAQAQLLLESTDVAPLEAFTNADAEGAGVAFYDMDGDGDDDAFVARPDGRVGVLRATPAGLIPAGLEVPRAVGIDGDLVTIAPTDLDGDGAMDLLLGYAGGVAWLRGGRDGLRDVSPRVFDGRWRDTYGFALADVDGDGRLDVYVVAYLAGFDRVPGSCDRDALFLQREDGAARAPVPDERDAGCGLAAVFFDADGDGDPDGVVGNDFGTIHRPNEFLVNDGIGPDGALRLRLSERATARPVALSDMGLGVGDLDGDGRLDLAHSSIGRADLLRGRGDGTFEDVTDAYGVGGGAGLVGRRVTWSAIVDDLDGDGRVDLLQSGGFIQTDVSFGTRRGGAPSFFFAGRAATPWPEDATVVTRATGGPEEHRAAVPGDVDLDGDPDLLVAGAERTPPRLLRNRTPRGPWLVVAPRGTVSPREPRGAVVTLACGAHRATSVVSTGGHMGSMAPPRVFLSLAPCRDATAAEVVVAWPSGVRSVTAVDPRRGGVVAPEEPRWLAVDRPSLAPLAGRSTATVTVTPRDDRGLPLGARHDVRVERVAGDARVSPTTRGPDGSWRATVSADAPGEVWLAVAVDGRRPHARVRLPVLGAAPTGIAVAPPAISPARPARVVITPRRDDGTALGRDAAPHVEVEGGTLAGPLADLGDGSYAVVVRALAGRAAATLRVAHPSITPRALTVPVVADVDPAATRVFLEPGYVREDRLASTALRVYVLPVTPLGDPFVPDPRADQSLRRADGTDLGAVPLAMGGEVVFTLPAAWVGLRPFEVRVGGVAVRTASLRAARDDADMARSVDLARSEVNALQAALRADGVDETTVMVTLRDAVGDRVPLPVGEWRVEGGRAAPEGPEERVEGTALRVIAGTSPGALRVTARVAPGVELTRAIPLLPPLAPVVADALSLCVAGGGGRVPGEALLRVRALVRGPGGVLAEGGRDLAVTFDGAPLALTARAWVREATVSVRADRGPIEVRAVERGSAVPPLPTAALAASLSLPVRDLIVDPPPPDAWFGEERCVTTARAPGDAAVPVDAAAREDAAVDVVNDVGVAPDVPPAFDAAPDAGGDGRPDDPGGCGCGAGGRARDGAAWWAVLALALLAARRRR